MFLERNGSATMLESLGLDFKQSQGASYPAQGATVSSLLFADNGFLQSQQNDWSIFYQDGAATNHQKSRTNKNDWALGAEKATNLPSVGWTDVIDSYGTRETYSLLSPLPHPNKLSNLESFFANGDARHLSSSLPALFNTKLTLSDTEPCVNQFGDTNVLQKNGKNEKSLLDLESHTICNLLPNDEEQLLAGIIDDFDCNFPSCNLEDPDDLDLFSSGGGLELEGDLQEHVNSYLQGFQNLDVACYAPGSQLGVQIGPASVAGEHPFGEHPSRTLFVRNINSNVEDIELRALFEQYGEIRTLYTACKHRGFVMISYYDIRAARSAMRALQNKPLRRRKLDIHFSIPKDNPSDKDINQGTLVVFNLDASVSNDDLRQIFGVYGEVKEIRETPHKRHHKFIEFYDVRAAEAALRALNRSDIAGKRIKLEPSRPGGTRRSLMQQLGQELDVEENRAYCQLVQSPMSPCTDSSPGYPSQLGSLSIMSENGSVSGSVNNGNLASKVSNIGGIASISSQKSPNITGTTTGQKLQLAHNVGQLGIALQRMPLVHAHSLPESNISIRHSFNPAAGSVSTLPTPSTYRSTDGSDASRLPRASSGVNDVGSFGSNGVIGAPRSESLFLSSAPNGSLACQQFLWGHSSPFSPSSQSASQLAWPNSFNQGGHPHSYAGPHGQHRLITAMAPHVQQIGSAATSGETSIVGHQNGFIGDSPGMMPLPRSDSVGAVGMGRAHPTTIGGVTGLINIRHPYSSCGSFDQGSSPNFGVLSPQLRTRIPPFVGAPGSLDGLNDRARLRRGDSFSAQVDNKKQFQLDLERILQGEDARTTLMIKNIPNKYTSKMLLAAIDEQFRGTYDFIYLPIDFKNKCNVGYAFINMISPSHIVSFYQAFNGKKWEKFNSEKVASLAYARIQGKAALIAHFQNSSLMNEDKRCRPILFHSEGPNMGDQEPFPIGDNVRTRPGRDHSSNGGSFQGSPTATGSKDDAVARNPDSSAANETNSGHGLDNFEAFCA
ncbi:hypothetical protein O6H91_13G016700 [Diphasiastrum complanatum]|uniref:Uncharacterized protein n=1 Tax=Diphasiastrum complanatum TaxID=34168 RepID=A0ACC2BSI5_DIPCM|nr:hypothetical protein O6H91_13G016700 [Diphasiastrum complanatum]